MLNTPRFAAEALEQRIAPAGVVHVQVRGGDLFLTGDRDDHFLEISPGEDGSLTLTPLAGTQFQFAGEEPSEPSYVLLGEPIRDIHYSGGAAVDDLRLADLHTIRNVTVALGGGMNNTLNVDRSDVQGALRVTGTGDENTVFINAGEEVTTIARELSVHFTRGNNFLSASGSGLQVGGSVRYLSGSGTDDVNMVTDRLDILGSLELYAGRGLAFLNASGISGAAIHGRVLVQTSAAGEDFTAVGFGSEGEFFFGGQVLVIGSSAGDDLAFDAGKLTLAKGLTARMGAGANSVDLRGGEIAVAGDLTIASDGTIRAEVHATERVLVEGKIAVSAKHGEDAFTLQGAGLVRGKVTLALGDGFSQTILRGPVAKGRLVLQSGFAETSGGLFEGPDSEAAWIEIVNVVLNGRTSINTQAGGDLIYFNGGAINAPVVVNTGGSGDAVVLFSQAAPLVVNAPMTILTGGDMDIISIGFEGPITANAPITVVGGAGVDQLDYLTYGNTLATPLRVRGVEVIT